MLNNRRIKKSREREKSVAIKLEREKSETIKLEREKSGNESCVI